MHFHSCFPDLTCSRDRERSHDAKKRRGKQLRGKLKAKNMKDTKGKEKEEMDKRLATRNAIVGANKMEKELQVVNNEYKIVVDLLERREKLNIIPPHQLLK